MKKPKATLIVFLPILLLHVLLCGQKGVSQTNAFKFSHLTVEDGLSQGGVFSIYQDHKGLIWLGTRDGLNKFDTRKFTVYRNQQGDSLSLSDNYVISLFEDRYQRLWVGTYSGLNLYDSDLEKFHRVILTGPGGNKVEKQPLIFSIREDRNGRVWVASSVGLYVLEKNTDSPTLVFHQDLFADGEVGSSAIQDLYEDKEGNIWLCTENGLYLTEPTHAPQQGTKLTLLGKYFSGKNGQGLNDDNVTTILEINEGVFWIGTKTGGINVYNKIKNEFTYITHQNHVVGGLADNEIRSILKDRKGGYWVGTFKGLNYFSEEGEWSRFVADQKDPYSLSHNSIRPIFQDQKGDIWVGTYLGGVNILFRDIPVFDNYTYSPYTNSLSHHVVSSIVETGSDEIWIGTDGGGINFLNRKSGNIKSYLHDPSDPHSISHNSIKVLHIDKKGHLWIGTYLGGVNLLRKGSDGFEHIKNDPAVSNSLSDNSVYAIAEDRQGGMWFGTHGGGLNHMPEPTVHAFDLYSEFKTGQYHLSSDYIRTLMVDSEDNLWVGTENGLNVKWKGRKEFEIFNYSLHDSSSISGEMVVSLFEDKKGRIWAGTYSHGLNLFDPETKGFIHFTTQDGLAGNNIFGISEDDQGNLWLSTNNGISKFNPEQRSAKNFDKDDGISGNEFVLGAYTKLKNGEIAFGSSQGLTVFHPDSLKQNTYVPPVVLTDLKLFNKSVEPGEKQVLKKHISATSKITLKHDQNIFTIEFAVLNYLFPKKNQFAYKLDGFEEAWNYVNNPSATYTNLNAGNYTFLVKGANNDGLWNHLPATLEIKILPPPWKTWWAYTLYGCMVMGSVLLLVNFIQVRAKLQHDLQLEHLEKVRQEEIHEIKLNFFTNISHEFRTPLTLIITPIEQLLKESKIPEDSRYMLQIIKRNTNKLLKLVNQLLDFRKQESGMNQPKIAPQDLVKFLQEVLLTFGLYAQEKNISLKFERNIDGMHVYVDLDMIEKVIVNLLSNAFKYTPENGEIVVSIDKLAPDNLYPKGAAKFSVRDNGIGIPEEDLKTIFNSFYQVNDHHNSCQNPANSSGLGLALAKSIVKAHGGEIYASSDIQTEAANETTFVVLLPLGKAHFEENQLDVSGPEGDHTFWNTETWLTDLEPVNDHYLSKNRKSLAVSKPENQGTLLIVEDNEELRMLMAESLRDSYKVLEARDGEIGWKIAQKHLPDLVISDIMMPKCDGIALLSLIKGDLQTSHIPVILLTARTSMESMLTGLKTGSDDYITKPFQIDVLKLKVTNILKNRESFRKKFVREYLLNPKKEDTVSPEDTFLKSVVKIIEENIGQNDFNVTTLAFQLGLSRPVLYRKLKQLTDLSVIELINHIRLKKAAQLVLEEGATISDVAYKVGFSDPKYFSKSFKAFFGKSPRDFAAESGAAKNNSLAT
ncbi:two-component regulator propeller domain-containing protein [Negadavirga shengliensis]|uniref:histidine kinase n=1 Tax=Negadavirga shengliensis TaxID=1389218 RepID=A0ABV9T369_9BACT